MSRAGYADFFPAAPSVLAKKAEAERAAKEKARQVHVHDDYDRDATGVLSIGSTASTSSVPPSHPNPTLTPSTSHSSPPTQVSPASVTAKLESQTSATTTITNGDYKDPLPSAPPSSSSLLTPKATPPATSLKSEPQTKRDHQGMRARNELGDDRSKTPKQNKSSTEAEGVCCYIFSFLCGSVGG
jgi:histone-lysine N-methyltransferase SETD1